MGPSWAPVGQGWAPVWPNWGPFGNAASVASVHLVNGGIECHHLGYGEDNHYDETWLYQNLSQRILPPVFIRKNFNFLCL